MKQDSRSPEQNRSLHPHPLPPDIESRVYIHKAILRKNINFKTDSFLRLFTDIILGSYWRPHDSFKNWLLYLFRTDLKCVPQLVEERSRP